MASNRGSMLFRTYGIKRIPLVLFVGTRLGDLQFFVGPWSCRVTIGGPTGRFANGSSWHSGWFRWERESGL